MQKVEGKIDEAKQAIDADKEKAETAWNDVNKDDLKNKIKDKWDDIWGRLAAEPHKLQFILDLESDGIEVSTEDRDENGKPSI